MLKHSTILTPRVPWTLITRNTVRQEMSSKDVQATTAADTARNKEWTEAEVHRADARDATFAKPLFVQTVAANVWAATLSDAADNEA